MMTEAIGTRIKKLREKKGMTLEELAGGVLSVSYLSELERGVKTNPTLRILNLIMVRLDEPLVQLSGVQVDRSDPSVDPR